MIFNLTNFSAQFKLLAKNNFHRVQFMLVKKKRAAHIPNFLRVYCSIQGNSRKESATTS